MIIVGAMNIGDYYQFNFVFTAQTSDEEPLIEKITEILKPIQEQMHEKYWGVYQKYDINMIPIAFDWAALAKDTNWWSQQFTAARTLIENVLNDRCNFQEYDQFVSAFLEGSTGWERVFVPNSPTNDRILNALHSGETVDFHDPICRDDYQEPSTKEN